MARRVALMSPAKWFPYGLIVAWVICASALAWAISQEVTPVVQAMYVLVITLAIAALLANLMSAIAVAAKRFARYWASGFPALAALSLLGYGIFKATLSPVLIAVLIGCAALGYVVGLRLPSGSLRFVPLMTVAALLFVGELSVVPREVKASTLILCSGLMTAALMRMRNRESGSV